MNDVLNHINTHVVTFDAENFNWASTPEYNTIFLRSVQTLLNQRVYHFGHVFLNEVLDDLGFPRTRPGAVQGWIYDPNHPNHPNPIQLKITETDNNALVITIVTDGNIYDKI